LLWVTETVTPQLMTTSHPIQALQLRLALYLT